jgi:DNA polymerase-3 subunit delta
MKLEPRRVEGFLDNPGACRAVLLFGDDVGMIRERSNRLVRAVAGALDDPFRVAELERDGLPRLAEEMASRALTGGRRVVRLRDVTDAATTAVTAALERGGEALLVLEAPGLASRAKLRTALERAPDAVAIQCYPLDGGSLEQLIVATLAGLDVSVTPDARTWLASQLGADQAVTRAELEKLALYVGKGGQVDLAAAEQCVGDLAGLSLEDALYAATSGEVAETDRALELAMAEGTAAVALLRGTLMHLQKLQRARAAMAAGASAGEAAKGVRPPVFFKREPAFVQALRLWPEPALEAAATRVWEAERACKRTGTPAETLCRSVLLGLAQRAAQQRRR